MTVRTGGKLVPEMERDFRAREVLTVRCAFCPEWVHTGSALEMLPLQDEHRARHGLRRIKRRQGAVNGVVRMTKPNPASAAA